MILIFISLFILLPLTSSAEYEDNLVGTCEVVGKELRANFYVRNDDKHFRFEYINYNGEVVVDTSVEHRQNIFTKKYGIKVKDNKVVIKAKDSFYKADFVFYTEKQTAMFKHKKSCIRHWPLEPCELYVAKYRADFVNCDLDFSDYIDY